jgi:hypothetical protein
MATVFDPYQFRWWRFSQYELKDKYIRPAPGAKLELYDPWKAYRESWDYDPDSATPWTEKRQKGPPYQSLLALANEVKVEPGFKLDKKSTELLLNWCAEFGLLGILPQRAHMVALAPRWLPDPPWGAAVGTKLKRPRGGNLYPTQFIYYRNNLLFLNMEGTKVQGWDPVIWNPKELGSKGHRLGEIYEGKIPIQPGVLMQEWDFYEGHEYRSVKVSSTLFPETFRETWAKFFPSIPKKEVETYLYPPMLSRPFWEIYSERLADFFMGVLALKEALLYLSEPSDLADELERRFRMDGMRLLNNLVSSASMGLATAEDGSLRQEWWAASLLGCFAMMALQDLTQQRKVIRCETCNRLFVTEAYQARYCTDRCRHTAQKRRYRQRLKEGEENG